MKTTNTFTVGVEILRSWANVAIFQKLEIVGEDKVKVVLDFSLPGMDEYRMTNFDETMWKGGLGWARTEQARIVANNVIQNQTHLPVELRKGILSIDYQGEVQELVFSQDRNEWFNKTDEGYLAGRRAVFGF